MKDKKTGYLWKDKELGYSTRNVCHAIAATPFPIRPIDLNPVRAGITDEPGSYRWSGYAEAMAGKTTALEGITKITGAIAEREHGQGLGEAAPVETAGMRKRRQLRALIHYRQMLGLAGRPRVSGDGKVVRRGVSAKVRARLEGEGGVRRVQLMKRVRHFSDGVILGSRAFIDVWFQQERSWFDGRSRTARKSGARKISTDWQGIYSLRQLGQRG